MSSWKATACACSNIATIKYWGNIDDTLRLPANGSLSMNLAGLQTYTTVTFDPAFNADSALLDGKESEGAALARIAGHLDHLRKLAGQSMFARVESSSNFPTGAGIASSASAFSALTLAVAGALGLTLTERQLSAIARLGSGSASRSVPSGFVEWHAASTHEESYAESIASADHWPLMDVVALVNKGHKATGSTEGHRLAASSPLQTARVADAPRRLKLCREAILDRDFQKFADVVEQDSDIMHAVMMTGKPALFYWQPTTLAVMEAVRELRNQGVAVCYTIDAGPNVHCLCLASDVAQVQHTIGSLPGVLELLTAGAGGPAHMVE
jgi:diphosphomevalonate decarboxylase